MQYRCIIGKAQSRRQGRDAPQWNIGCGLRTCKGVAMAHSQALPLHVGPCMTMLRCLTSFPCHCTICEFPTYIFVINFVEILSSIDICHHSPGVIAEVYYYYVYIIL